MSDDGRQDVVEHVTKLLEADILSVDEYQSLVDRILAVTTTDALQAIVDSLPVGRPLVLECAGGSMRSAPVALGRTTEIRVRGGSMLVDLTQVELATDVDLDIDIGGGSLRVIVPVGMAVHVGDQHRQGGKFTNEVRTVPEPGQPRLVLHLRIRGGSVVVRHPSR